jgi:hypothetical protein
VARRDRRWVCYCVPMSDRPKDPAAETPIERALRMKKAALKSKANPPGGRGFPSKQAAGIAAGASKPAMKK